MQNRRCLEWFYLNGGADTRVVCKSSGAGHNWWLEARAAWSRVEPRRAAPSRATPPRSAVKNDKWSEPSSILLIHFVLLHLISNNTGKHHWWNILLPKRCVIIILNLTGTSRAKLCAKKCKCSMEVYIIVGMAVLIYTFVTLLLNSECWNPEHQKCQCEECKSLCSGNRAITPSVLSVSSRIDVIERP